jgi:hypothetical protein
VAFPRDETAYLQLALKLNTDSPAREPEGATEPVLMKDPVVS